MKHIIASLVWIMILVGILVGYGNYVSQLSHSAGNFSNASTVPQPLYSSVFTNGSAMATSFH